MAFENFFSGFSMEETFGNIEIIVRFIIFFQKFLLFGSSRSFSTLIEYGGREVFIELDLREVFCGSVNGNIHALLRCNNGLTYYVFIIPCSVYSTKNYSFLERDCMCAKENIRRKLHFGDTGYDACHYVVGRRGARTSAFRHNRVEQWQSLRRGATSDTFRTSHIFSCI